MDVLTLIAEEDTAESILSKVAEQLYELGYVKETYKTALLEREKQYPTGLHISEELGVALPHADVEHVNKEALVIIKPLRKVAFRRMDDPASETYVSMIFLLVIKNPKGYVKFLSKLCSMFSDEEFLRMLKYGDIESIQKLIQREGLLELRDEHRGFD